MARGGSTLQMTKKIKKSKIKKFGSYALANLWYGIMRGIGTALGFSGIAVVLIFVVQFIPLTSIPIIGDIIQGIINSARG